MNAIWTKLYPIHMPVPTKKDFMNISTGFYSKYKIPHCIGCIDGRHVKIRKPSGAGSEYRNYKGYDSIAFQAVVDDKYRFIFLDAGAYGSQHDSTTFRASDLFIAMARNLLDLPKKKKILGSDFELPYYFIGDGAYTLMENMMKPFPGQNLTKEKLTYNKRVSGVRVMVENAFGFTCQIWRIFYSTIQLQPDKVELIIKCTCILHNILIDLEEIKLDTFKFADDLNEILAPLHTSANDQFEKDNFNDSLVKAKAVRECLVTYFEKNPKKKN